MNTEQHLLCVYLYQDLWREFAKSQTCSSFDLLRSELAEKEEGKEEEAEKRKKKLEEKAARKRELMLKSLME